MRRKSILISLFIFSTLSGSAISIEKEKNSIIDSIAEEYNYMEEQNTSYLQRPRFRRKYDLRQSFWVGTSVGLQTYFGDHNRQQSFTKAISIHHSLFIGYWFDNEIGIRLHGQGYKVKGITQNDSYTNGIILDAKEKLQQQEFKYFSTHMDLMYNLTPFINVNAYESIYKCVPYLGIGVARNISNPPHNSLSVSAGVYNSFEISSQANLFIEGRGILVSDKFDGEVGGRKGEGPLSLSFGVAVKL